MHQSRRTHNAHNETQRRLRKVLSQGTTVTYYPTPHYTYVVFEEVLGKRVHPSWVNTHISEFAVTSGAKNNRVFSSLEEAEFARNHTFLARRSKSSGRHSTYKKYKKFMHHSWRRKGFDEPSYTIRGSHYSYLTLIF